MRRCFQGLAAGIVMVVCGSVGLAQEKDPAYGTWTLNLAQSKYTPGPAPETLTVATSGVNAKGQTVKNTQIFDRQ
jgi:hypothetical protein